MTRPLCAISFASFTLVLTPIMCRTPPPSSLAPARSLAMYRSWLEMGPPLPKLGPTPSARLVVSLFFIFASERAKLETMCQRKPAFVGIAIQPGPPYM